MNLRRSLLIGLIIVMSFVTSFAVLSVMAEPAGAEPVVEEAGLPPLPLIADFEMGIPPGMVPFLDAWDGSGSTSTLAFGLDQDVVPLVPMTMPNNVISVTYDIATSGSWGGGPGYGGVVHDFAGTQEWTGWDGFSLWFYGSNSGLNHRIELKSDGGDAFNSNRYEWTFTDDVVGWRYLNIPFADFVQRTDFNPGPNPSDPLNLAAVWGYGVLLEAGNGLMKMDQVALTKITMIHDFQDGVPAGMVPFLDAWDGSGSTSTLSFGVDDVILPMVPVTNPNQGISVTYDIATSGSWGGGPGYGGIVYDYPATADWTGYDGFQLWFYGSNSGLNHRIEVKSDGGDAFNSNRYVWGFVDDYEGWRHLRIPFGDFVERTDFNPGPNPSDPFNLGAVWGYGVLLDAGNGLMKMDEVAIYGMPMLEASISLDSDMFMVVEGDSATVTVNLSQPSANTVTVDYATSDGTADGSDYTGVSGTLVFSPSVTSQQIVIDTIDDTDYEGDEDFTIALSNEVSATLGMPNMATITILENEDPPAPNPSKADVIDDFENGLPMGTDGDGNGLGFVTWGDFWNGTTVDISTTTTLDAGIADVPGYDNSNQVIELTSNVVGWGGFTHAFENATLDEWTPMSWLGYEGVAFWYYGTGTGTLTFVDVAENRNPGSTTDDAERWSFEWTDDTAGWQYIEIAFEDMFRKEIGNGAPNDGWTGEEVHGWALGTTATTGEEMRYVDDFGLTQRVTNIDNFENGLPSGTDGDGNGIGFVTWGDFWNGTTVDIATMTTLDAGIADVPGRDNSNQVVELTSNVVQFGGFTHAFENPGLDTWVNQDWSTYVGICFWYYGTGSGTVTFVDIAENRNPGSTTDDAERWSYEWTDDTAGWQFIQVPFEDLFRKEIGNGAPNDGWTGEEVHGWALGTTATTGSEMRYMDDFSIYGNTDTAPPLQAEFGLPEFEVVEGDTAVISITLSMTSTEPVSLTYATAESRATPNRDFTPIAGSVTIPALDTEVTINLPTLDDTKYEGDENLIIILTSANGAELGFSARTVVNILDNDLEDTNLLDDFEGWHPFGSTGTLSVDVTEVMAGDMLELPGQGTYEHILGVDYVDGSMVRTYAEPQDWSDATGITFWYYGANTGDTVTFDLLDNAAATTGDVDPSEWVMMWSDEFDDAAGTAPNNNVWTHELGDGWLNGIVGWGNGEFQYYTDSTDNAATDGAGNLVITLDETPDDSLLCWYGPCDYTSARIISADKIEVEYGRIEARIKVPSGGDGIDDGDGNDLGDGLWPAFWTLGNDIGEVGWPQSGEIDIMEVVTRLPYEVYGTIHGPGYEGGASFGNTYTFADPVSDDFHIFAVEWEPGEINWYVDGILYHTATPADVAPNEWVFDHPFYIILNLAIGGNFGGDIGDDVGYPQLMEVDYVRVYGAADSAERFEASFTDDFVGWQEVTLPLSSFARSADQPPGAPNDGLTMTDVMGYGFTFEESTGTGNNVMVYLDQVRIEKSPLSVSFSGATGEASGSTLQAIGLFLFVAVIFGLFVRRSVVKSS